MAIDSAASCRMEFRRLERKGAICSHNHITTDTLQLAERLSHAGRGAVARGRGKRHGGSTDHPGGKTPDVPKPPAASVPAPLPADTSTPVKAKAKAVIHIWLWGGPSQLDTFDPKPDAGYDYCGPFNKPIATNVPGIQICELLPLLAKQADKYSIIRSMTHGNNGHETAAYMMLTGHKPGDGIVYPAIGALVSYFKGYGNGYTGLIPPTIMLTEGLGRFAEEGFLGPLYKSYHHRRRPQRETIRGGRHDRGGNYRSAAEQPPQLLHSLDALGKAHAG